MSKVRTKPAAKSKSSSTPNSDDAPEVKKKVKAEVAETNGQAEDESSDEAETGGVEKSAKPAKEKGRRATAQTMAAAQRDILCQRVFRQEPTFAGLRQSA
ncbi:MAG: hypothetical protein QM811_15450 [Pirellulales bacterium]